MGKYERAHDMDSWRRDPRIAERGFAHRWSSVVAPGNGEDAFINLIEQHLHTEADVLDVGCGHGEFTLDVAWRCRSILGVERDEGYLQLARELAAERGVTNVRFAHANLADGDEPGRQFAGIPLPDGSIDIVINRRGPILRRYLGEALRVARPGAVMLGLHPTGNTKAPPWRDELPVQYRDVFNVLGLDEVSAWVTDPLHTAGLTAYSLWWIDVPEYLRTPHELHIRLGGEGSLQAEIETALTDVFERWATPRGLIVRHQRLMWKAQL